MTCYGVDKSVTVLTRVLRVDSVTVLTCGVLPLVECYLPVGIICCKTVVSVKPKTFKVLMNIY